MKRSILSATLGILLSGVVLAPAVHAGKASPAFMAHHGHLVTPTKVKAQPPARLGVAISAIPQSELDTLSLEYGVRIAGVMDGSAAAASGIEAGDIVTEVDGRPAYSPQRLQHLVAAAGARSVITVSRDGASSEKQVSYSAPEAAKTGKAVLGIRIQEMTADLKEAFGTTDRQGVLVSQVMRDSPAASAGIKAGDVLVSIAGKAVEETADVREIMDGQNAGESVEIVVVRDREPKSLEIALGSHPVMSARGKPAGKPYGHHGHGLKSGKYCHPHGKDYKHS